MPSANYSDGNYVCRDFFLFPFIDPCFFHRSGMAIFALTVCLHLVVVVGTALSGSTGNETCPSDPCGHITPLGLSLLRKRFSELSTLQSAFIIRFNLKITSTETPENIRIRGQQDTFDPTSWLWMSRDGKYILDMPLDYDFASLGMLTLREYDLDVYFTDGGSCLALSEGVCRDEAIARILGTISSKSSPASGSSKIVPGLAPSEFICRSAYTYSSFLSSTKDKVALGWKCCTSDDFLASRFSCNTVVKETKVVHQRVLFSLVIIFSVAMYILSYSVGRLRIIQFAFNGRVWDWLGNYFGFGSNSYRTYIIKGEPEHIGHWVHLSDEDLLSDDYAVTIPELWRVFGGSTRSGRCLVVFRFLFILILFAIVACYAIPMVYDRKGIEMGLFRSGEEIAINLYLIPIAWWRTSEKFWPRGVGVFLVIGIFLNQLLELMLVMVFSMGFREHPPKDPSNERMSISRRKWRPPPIRNQKPSIVAMALATIFFFFDVCLGLVLLVAVIYSVAQILVCVCLAIIIHLDIFAPWLAAAIMVVFHLMDNLEQARRPYARIRMLLHDEFLQRTHSLQAEAIEDILSFEMKYGTEGGNNEKKQPPSRFQKIPYERLSDLLVVFQHRKRPAILLTHFLNICDHLVDRRRNVFKAVARTLVFFTYVLLIVFSVTVYRSPTVLDRSVEGLVTGCVVFVLLLLPYIYRLVRDKRTAGANTVQWRFEIRRYLDSLLTNPASGATRCIKGPSFKLRQKQRWTVTKRSIEGNSGFQYIFGNIRLPTHFCPSF